MKRLSARLLILPGLALMAAAGVYLWRVGPWAADGGPAVTEGDRQRAAKAVEEGRALYVKASNPQCRDWDVQALDAYRRFLLALSCVKDSVDAHEGAARAALLLGRTGPAIEHADFILKRDPANALAHEIRGEAQWMMAYESDGCSTPRPIKAFGATRTPPIPDFATKMRQQADADFAKAGDDLFPLRKAEALFRSGDLAQAEALATTANARLSERAMLLAMIDLERGGDPSVVIDALVQRQFTPAIMVRARLAFVRGDWEMVRKDAELARDAHTEWPDPWLYWGTACLRLGRLAEARDAFKRLSLLDADLAKPGVAETDAAIKKFEAEGKTVPPVPPIQVRPN